MNVVYILRCSDGSLYTGSAKDLSRRLEQHAAGRASRYTRSRLPVTLLWTRRVRSWSDALKTECWIKTLSRAEKDALVGGARPRRGTRPRSAEPPAPRPRGSERAARGKAHGERVARGEANSARVVRGEARGERAPT